MQPGAQLGQLGLALVLFVAAAVDGRAQSAIHDQVLIPDFSGIIGAPSNAQFGTAIAVAEPYMFVTARNLSLNLFDPVTGGVFVFTRNAEGAWIQDGVAFGLDATPIGASLAIDGERLMSGGVGLYSNGHWPGGSVQFVERQAGAGWPTTGYFTREDVGACERFGAAADLDSDWAVVGAPGNALAGMGERGDVSLFHRSVDGTWEFVQMIAAPNVTDAGFGASVAIDGDSLLVATEYSTLGATVNGAVYAYRRTTGDTWVFEQELAVPGSAPLSLAYAQVALGDDRAVVGAPRQQTGTFAQQRYGTVFEWSREPGGRWNFVDTLAPSDPDASIRFGSRIELRGSRLIVQSEGRANGTSAGDGNGSVDLFERDGALNWIEVQRFAADETVFTAKYGAGAVALTDESIYVGLPAQNRGQLAIHDIASLYRSARNVDLSAGGSQELFLRPGHARAGDLFVVLGSASGTSPAIDLGIGHLDLVADAYTAFLLENLGGGIVAPFAGSFDGQGRADSAFAVQVGTSASFAGLTLNHAYLAFDAATLVLTHVSNSVAVQLVP